MGVARYNKSTGDMLAACRDKHKATTRNQKQQANKSDHKLKQTSLSYWMLGPADRQLSNKSGSKSNKSLASSEEEDEEEVDEPALVGRKKLLLAADRLSIEPDAREVTLRQQQQQQRSEPNAFLQRKNARSSCYVWLAAEQNGADGHVELQQPPQSANDEPCDKMKCRPSERHIRLALSSRMLHESLSSFSARSGHDLEQFHAGDCWHRPAAVSCQSLAGAGGAGATATNASSPTSTKTTRKSGNRRKLRQRHKLVAGASCSQEWRRSRRRRPIVCDSDSDACEAGEPSGHSARASAAKAQHHARSAADLSLMLHNCETIDASERSRATPALANSAADSDGQAQRCAIAALAERQFATDRSLGGSSHRPQPPDLSGLLQQTTAQPGQRRHRPTSSAPENNATERRQASSPHHAEAAAAAAADKLASDAELASRPSGHQPLTSRDDCETRRGSSAEPAFTLPDPNRTLSGQDQDQSWLDREPGDGVEHSAKFKLTEARVEVARGKYPDEQADKCLATSGRRCDTRNCRQQAAAAAAAAVESNPMGVDVNHVVSRLVDTCAQSWRRSQNSLLGSYSSSAGCYKVAQLAASESVRESDQQRNHHHQQQQQEQEVAVLNANCDSSKPTTSRLTRPGRSPVSLQRQTNARLARHRLKIQEQRQQQLANLAWREREQFQYGHYSSHHLIAPPICSTTSFHSSQQSPDHTEIEILESEPAGERPRRSSLEHSLNYFRSLIGRLPAHFNPSRRQSRELTSASSDQDSLARSGRLPLANLNAHLPPRGRGGRSFRVQPAGEANTFNRPVASSSTSNSGHSDLTIEPSRLQRAIDANISSSSRSRSRQRDLVQVLAQANVIVHRSPHDLLRDGRGAAGNANSQGHHHQQRHHETRRSVCQSQASRGQQQQQQRQQQQQSQAQQHQFRFQYHNMASEHQNGKSNVAREADDSRSNSGDSSASSTLSLNKPFCKICHLSSSRHGDKLISPCKCSGTMQYVHCGCLLKWLEISNRTNEKQPMSCELCAHEYTWHKRFNLKQMKLPKCSIKDILLHSMFVLALGVMMFCALAPMFNTTRPGAGGQPVMAATNNKAQLSTQAGDELKLSSRGAVTFGDDALGSLMSNPSRRSPSKSSSGSRLANDEKFILFCAAAFFVSFFIAIYVQTKARDTLYGLIVKFANMNLTYYITEYDHGQQQQQLTSNKSTATADHSNSLCSPTDSNHGDLNHCQQPAPGDIHEAQPLPDRTHGRHYFESPSAWRHFKRT